ILVTSLVPGTHESGDAVNFNPSSDYTWTLATFTGSLIGVTPEALADHVILDTLDFANEVGGGSSFDVQVADVAGHHELQLLYSSGAVAGNWDGSFNWTGASDDHWENGTPPGGSNVAVFNAAATNPPTLYGAAEAQGLDFQTGGWTIGGTGQTLTVGSSGISSATGANTIEPNVALGASQQWTVAAGTLAVNGNVNLGGNVLTKAGSGGLEVRKLLAGSLDIEAGKVTLAVGVADTNTLTALTIAEDLGGAATAKLDLRDRALAINYTGASPLADVSDWIRQGYKNFAEAWSGNGITSSDAALDKTKVAIGYAENGNLGAKYGPGNPFNGDLTDVDNTTLLVKFTLQGDVDLNGIVNDDDVTILATYYGWANMPWWLGDVSNYDGVVNDDDITVMATNYGHHLGESAGGGSAPDTESVPEPATLALVAVGGLMALARRRRK
ncbi:MAG: PEP-CTERM sorting domain-containing protein, partial [Planctomycetota bacterium]|nr:PEP-CTERM sorting domain-containing protein [Planctomycetota bacterium]